MHALAMQVAVITKMMTLLASNVTVSRREVRGLLQTLQDAADTESPLHLDLLSGGPVAPQCSEAQMNNTVSGPGGPDL